MAFAKNYREEITLTYYCFNSALSSFLLLELSIYSTEIEETKRDENGKIGNTKKGGNGKIESINKDGNWKIEEIIKGGNGANSRKEFTASTAT